MELKVYYTSEGDKLSLHIGLKDLLLKDEVYDCFVDLQKIKMVGSYMFSNSVLWYSFPKYYQLKLVDGKISKSDQHNMKVIMKVIEKLRYSGKNLFEGDHIFTPDSRNEQKRKVNIIELSTYIVKDYMSNDIYTRGKKEFTQEGFGKTTWARTINKNIPIISDNNIVYSKLWKRKSLYDDKNEISIIHAYIVNKAIEIYEQYNGYIGLKKPEDIVEIQEENLAEYSKILNQELLHVFGDREISLIKALIAWCEATYNYKIAGCTNCFQNVWEWVNDEVFGNQFKKQSQYPIYELKDEHGKMISYTGRGTAKPDTIFFRRVDEHNQNYLYVYDSKYYLPNPSKQDIYEYPSNSDIVKQVAYLRGICESLTRISEPVIAKNIFLLPEIPDKTLALFGRKKEDNILYSELGYVIQANFDSMAEYLTKNIGIEVDSKRNGNETDEKEKVYLYMVYCSKLYDMYLKSKKYVPEN
jgi:hypothetical protein